MVRGAEQEITMTNDGWGKEWPKPIIPKPEWLNDVTDITGKVHSNKMPTHDPYTNPDSQIYYQCSCGAILDPGTKSFAALNNCASENGWKVRWGATSYQPYCVECGKDVE